MHCPGVYQNREIEPVNQAPEVMEELNERFALIFSGQRRLARNVLREELARCIENNVETLAALARIRSLCVLMKFELEQGNVTQFARYVTEQFALVKTIDKGASNTYIEYIFDVCDDLIDGKSICGAGGGGFLQVILKKGITKEIFRERLEKVFGDCGVKLWECELI
jgi:fucokinase